MTDLKVWCLLIDHEKKATFGGAFPIEVSRYANVYDLIKKINKERPVDLRHVDSARLTVRRRTDETDLGNMDSESFEKNLTEVFEKEEVEKLKPEWGIGQYLNKTVLIEIPDNETIPHTQFTPRKTKSKAQALVDDVLHELEKELYSLKLEEELKLYVSGPPWDYFRKDSSDDNEIARHINELQIPRIASDPVLLLHDLGGDVVDATILDGLFSGTSSCLFNTSGSGKTRLLFEGLSKHWGFYFTMHVNSSNHWLGSVDMMFAISELICNSFGFTNKPANPEKKLPQRAYKTNHDIARRHFLRVLWARTLIFEHYLKAVRDTHPDRSINAFKKQWLFLQLHPQRLVGIDIFRKVALLLTDASDEYLMMEPTLIHENLERLQREFGLGEDFYLILDEAQKAIKDLDGCFCSADGRVQRPILRPIVASWAEASEFPIIVSGTGLSIDVVNEVVTSATVKREPFTLVTETGGFEDREGQSKYIKRYMPAKFAESESGKKLLERAWNWTRGRHRFTAALVGILVEFSFQSPHRVLNAYIERLCGIQPNDDQPRDEKEIQTNRINFISLDFERTRDFQYINTFRDVLFTWLMHRKVTPIPRDLIKLVELGFARFASRTTDAVVIDEPLVILGATSFFERHGGTFRDYIEEALKKNAGDGVEKIISYYFACAFDDGKSLCDVFEFGGDVPEWAKEPAHLVSVSSSGAGVEYSRCHLPDFLASTTLIGMKCSSVEETMAWFKNPSTLMCLPDENMGPDIVLFVRLDNGLVLAVALQCKRRSKEETPAKNVLNSAVSTTRPSSFYESGNLSRERSKEAGRFVRKEITRLCRWDTKQDGWFEDEVPVLGAIVTYPAEDPPRLPDKCVSLNMGTCVAVADKKGMLESMKCSLGIKRAREAAGTDEPAKRLRRQNF